MNKKCIGCGVKLQKDNPLKDGYISQDDFRICERCFNIKNYGQNKITKKTNVDYLKIINKIGDNDLVVYVSNLLTLNLDYIDKFKNVLLVLTKRDVLPKSIKDEKIINYVKSRHSNVIDVLIVSAVKKYNLDQLYNKLNKYSDKKIYFVGITNSGKSTLINQMINSYGDKSGEITTSNYPSTTLGLVNVVIDKLNIFDTPGLVINNSIVNTLDNKGIKKINSKKEIKPITFQIEGSGAVLVDKLMRIQYETDKSSMTLYMSNNLKIDSISLKNSKMLELNSMEFTVGDNQDLVIEDIGFIKFTKKTIVKIYCENKLYMYVRDNLI